jgi:glycerol-3-phosphate dehydrogenase
MRRDLSRFVDTRFDLLVIGAGIHGACIAWDACLRGLSVAVVDQEDFGAATSANSLGIIHGGLRYLARGDLPRMLESIRERSALLRIAPKLVEPLPVLVPTYQDISRGRATYRVGLALNDLVSWGRNRGLSPDRLIPPGRVVSPEESLRLFPGFSTERLSGGALWYDARLRHPERLTLSFLHSAARRGCVPVNYLRVDRLRVDQDTIQGALVTDRVRGRELEVRSHAVVVAAGPWTRQLTEGSLPEMERTAPSQRRALAMNLVIGRRLADVAIGVQAHSGLAEDPVCGGHRFLFAVPQGAMTLLGTWYSVDEGSEVRTICQRGMFTLLREFNEACPGVGLLPSDVVRSQWGWLPLKDGLEPGRAMALAERPRIVDHASTHGIRRLLSVEGVKYTTARKVAERVVNRVFTSLDRTSPPCQTAEVRLDEPGGEASLEPDGTMARADILYAIREEMALKLSDIVFRRSSMGILPGVSRITLEHMSRVAGAELGWDANRQEAEVEEVMRQFGIVGPAVEAVG